MSFYADLHIHSKHSRATSADCDLEHLSFWARRKGITVVGTGDFTHPGWRAELRDRLRPAEPGLYRLSSEAERHLADQLPGGCDTPTRFMLTVEISTIYKKGDLTRKVHHLVFAPHLEAADAIAARLGRIGNLHSDGRPILGLDSRDLLEVVLEVGQGSVLVPAHVWTPWFAALGSKSGFDCVDDCYGDLAQHVFAIETGLSSDPTMCRRVSSLDRFRLMSNSDAHSPAKLGREACAFDSALSYDAMIAALKTGEGYGGTVEFFPEEGKYHLDGHRSCGVRFTPEESHAHGDRCPVCHKPLTLGVLHRVDALADRPEARPADPFQSFVPLPEILAEITDTGPSSQKVTRQYEGLLARLGPELSLLGATPLDDIARAGSSLLAEAIGRMRAGQVHTEAGFDGEYGRVRLFDPAEIRRGAALFSAAAPSVAPARAPRPVAAPRAPAPRATPEPTGLDPEQQAAATAPPGPRLVLAGPGTGKTRTLLHRLAWLLSAGVAPERCLAVTYTRKAAEELQRRLAALDAPGAARIEVCTFHGLGHRLLCTWGGRVGVHRGFQVASEEQRVAALADVLGKPGRKLGSMLEAISLAKRSGADGPDPALRAAYQAGLEARGLLDYDDLIALSATLLETDAEVAAQERREHLLIDEFQDIDASQYRLVRALVAPGGSPWAVGDPDQAIYGFRGSDIAFFDRFRADFPGTQTSRLSRNYRSTPGIVDAAIELIDHNDGPSRALTAMGPGGARVVLHAAPTAAAEAGWVSRTLERMLGGSEPLAIDSGQAEGWTRPTLGFSDVAVLARTSGALDAVAGALDRQGIPIYRRNSERLLARADVAALVQRAAETTQHRFVRERLAAAVTPDTAAAAELLQPLAARAGEDFVAFQAALSLATEVDTLDPRAERVSLLTLHAAKGLEFRVVFLIGCEDGLLPLRFGPTPVSDAVLAEERRLFYVGMTRARDRLLLSWASRRPPLNRPLDPSPFLAEIERKMLDLQVSNLDSARQLSLW